MVMHIVAELLCETPGFELMNAALQKTMSARCVLVVIVVAAIGYL